MVLPGVNFIKALMPVFFYWCKNAVKIYFCVKNASFLATNIEQHVANLSIFVAHFGILVAHFGIFKTVVCSLLKLVAIDNHVNV